MKILIFLTLLITSQSNAFAETTKTEVIEEDQKVETRMFCSKEKGSKALAKCEIWLEAQKKTLGNRLLTSFCSEGEANNNTSCLYQSIGELKYILKKYQTETTIK